jgi:hypothetical protein
MRNIRAHSEANAAIFGGNWNNTSNAGVFTSNWNTNSSSTNRNNNIGFRWSCTAIGLEGGPAIWPNRPSFHENDLCSSAKAECVRSASNGGRIVSSAHPCGVGAGGNKATEV